ncbi:restriction endonuclease subunit S, partial [Citrobacter sp. Igbk 14]|uniref:restriction endonuclease subunit S n=1 Tax=Citrobacter sp. Igbk 14 TaxID=2963960 RepID=UPI002303E3C4
MAKYKAYPEYKDSGVEWLGEIPAHWKTVSIARLFSRNKRTGYAEKELLSVYRDYGVIPKSSRDDNNNKPSEDLSPYQLVEPDDLVMNKMKAWQGSIAISEYEGIVSPAYFVYQPNKIFFEQAHPRYVHYLLRNPIYITQYLSRSKGIRINQWDLDPDEFRNIELLLPSKSEQHKIFSFLDHETIRIDKLIEKQQQLIELLKEKRQAVISHAVTKGLNPDVPMKASGVEWLGEVPEHWQVLPTKRFFKLITEPAEVNNKHELLSVYSAIGVAPRKELEQKGNKATTTDGYWLVKEGDIIVNKLLAWMGAIGYSNYSGVTSPAYDILRKTKNINPKFYHYLFRLEKTQREFKRWSRGIMEVRLRLYFDELGQINMPVPSKDEQDKIVIN